MDIGSCFTMQQEFEFARFEQAADKTSAQRLSYMSAVPPSARSGFGANNVANLMKKFLRQKSKS